MSVVCQTTSVCVRVFMWLLVSSAGSGAEPSPPTRQPIDYIRDEIESRKTELVEIRKQRAERKTTTDRETAALIAANTEVKKTIEAQARILRRGEESTRVKALALKAEVARLEVIVRELTTQVAELRKTVDRAFSPRARDKPPATPANGNRQSPKVEPGENPFGGQDQASGFEKGGSPIYKGGPH